MNIRSHRRRPVSLDMTPLIDVVFLLLIFFMVSTTFDRETRLQIDLPSANAQENVEPAKKQIEITVDKEGHFFVDQRKLVTHDLATLARALEKSAKGNTDLPLVISSDRNAPFQAAITIMDAAGQLGMHKLNFIARQTSTSE